MPEFEETVKEKSKMNGHKSNNGMIDIGNQTYEWPKSFRKQVIALTLQKGWLARFPGVVLREYFEVLDERELIGAILEHHQKYQIAPLVGDLHKEFPDMQDDINDFFKLATRDLSKTSHEVIEWAKDQKMMLALVEGVKLLGQGKIKEIRPLIVEAQQVGNDVVKIGYDLTEDTEQWRSSTSILDVVGTPWSALNSKCGGGLGPGEIGTLVGVTGGKKTTALVNIGYWAAGLIYGMNVLHFTLEMSERKILDRYAARVMLDTFKEYRGDAMSKEFKAALRKAANEKLRGRVRVKQFPANQHTVEDLRDYTSMISELKGFVPDMVIVDYPALLNSRRNYKEKRFEYQEIFSDLRAWAIALDVPMWVVAQAKTSSYGNYILFKKDVAEDIGIAHISDLMISLNQTKDEEEADKVRFYVAKTREDKAGGHTRALLKYPSIIEDRKNPFVDVDIADKIEKTKEQWANSKKKKAK